MDNLNVDNILKIYENEISKNVKNKKKLYDFEINKMQYVQDIINNINNGYVGHNHYNIFLIYEPKCRLVMSLSIKDKVINHFVAKYLLEAKLSKYLDNRNTATRKNMGTSYAICLVKKYINILKNKYNNFYILKLDISKYFYSIDHDVLKCMVEEYITGDELSIVSRIIGSTNESYVNDVIRRVRNSRDIPIYEYKKGLPIGNMTSQFLSIFYLHKLDHYIIHDLKLKYYVRYMDDFIIMDKDREKLQKTKTIIINMLKNIYKLNVNSKKSFICDIKNGFSFLGYNYKVINNKTIIKIKRSNIEKVKKRIKQLRYLVDNKKINYYSAFCSIMTYTYSYKYANNRKIINIINKYWYNEK